MQNADLHSSVALALDVSDVAAAGPTQSRGDRFCSFAAREIVRGRRVRRPSFLVEPAKSEARAWRDFHERPVLAPDVDFPFIGFASRELRLPAADPRQRAARASSALATGSEGLVGIARRPLSRIEWIGDG